MDASGSESKLTKSEAMGWLLLAIPGVSTIFIWFWVGTMNLFQNPGSSLSLLGLLTITTTAALAAVEANQLGMGSETDVTKKGSRRENPLKWFFAILLIWPIAYPFYLHRRRLYGVRSMLGTSLLVVVIFVGSYMAIESTIEDARSALKKNLYNR